MLRMRWKARRFSATDYRLTLFVAFDLIPWIPLVTIYGGPFVLETNHFGFAILLKIAFYFMHSSLFDPNLTISDMFNFPLMAAGC